MDDLLQKQIRDSCKLALPDGLQDLMSDISREVLRAQPQNLLQFITDYLASLLVARENLFIASRVCDNVCKTSCYPELEDELREVGLSDEDVEKIVKVVTDFFESGGVKETSLMIKLLKKTEIDETQLPAVLEAVRSAFLRHQVNNTVVYESSSTDSDMDESLIAAKHTLKIYRKTKEPGDNYNSIVKKIQAAYRAYNVRRQFQRQNRERAPAKKNIAADKALRFDAKKVEMLFPGTPRSKRCSSKASSVSLAGSLVPLPSYKPYSIDDIFSEVDDVSDKEKEHNSFDYTQHWNNAPAWNEPGDKQKATSMKKKNISFHDLPQIINKNSEEVNDEIPEEIEDENEEFEEVDEELLEEQLVKDHALWPHCHTKPMEDKGEVKNTFQTEIIHEITNYDQVTHTPTIHDNLTKPMVENKMNKELAPVPIIKEYIAKQQKVNDEVKGKDDDDVVEEELTQLSALVRMIKKQTIRIGDDAELIAKNDEAENKDDDEIIAEEFITDLVPRETLEEEMMWYGDDYDRDNDDSDGESQEDVNIVEYFDNVSAAASFIDLS